VERHILRNYVCLHAIETKQPIPIGTQDASLLDDRIQDRDLDLFADEDDNDSVSPGKNNGLRTEADFHKQAGRVYGLYAGPLKKRFRWLSAERFRAQLKKDLSADINSLLGVLQRCGAWDPERDAKIKRLIDLISRSHPGQKLIVFSQFADTVVGAPAHGRYLYFHDLPTARWACATLNSSLFYLYFIAYGDCFHLSDALARSFPLPAGLPEDQCVTKLGDSLMSALRLGAKRTSIQTKDGHEIAYDEYFGWKAKPTIDEIDSVLATHYGFTDEELDFIINYDIKYRMGQDSGEGEEE